MTSAEFADLVGRFNDATILLLAQRDALFAAEVRHDIIRGELSTAMRRDPSLRADIVAGAAVVRP